MDLLRLLPRFWYQNKPTSLPWDKALNAALTKYGVSSVGAYEAKVGPFTVWIVNYPFAFGYNRADPLNQLPRCRTRMRLRRAIMALQEQLYMEQMQ